MVTAYSIHIKSISHTYSYRISITVMVAENEIFLLDISSHDEVYR